MSDSASLGRFIAERRQDLGLTHEQLAERVGINIRQSDVSRIERNKIALPGRVRLEQLAAALEVSLGDLLARSGWMTAGDGLAQDLDREAAAQAAAPPAALTAEDVRALMEAIDTTRALVATTLDSLTAADAALDRTLHTLQVPGERGKAHPPAGVIKTWETSQTF